MEIKTVGVLGCGLMGAGIAQVAAASGYKTVVRETSQALLDKGLGRIGKFLDDGVAKGKVTAEDRDKTLGNLTGTTDVGGLKACDLVIEAIIENLDDKAAAYAAVEAVVGEHTILASNTSSLCVTELAARTRRPDRFGGLHFFNPVPLMKLVEVVRALTTSDATYQSLFAFSLSLGKEPITAPDKPGFIVNRLLVPYLLDAIRCYERGLGSVEDIDKGMKLGCGHPMGPLTLLDFVGLDTTYYIANIMFDEYKDPMFAAPPLLKRMVLAGKPGARRARGFTSTDKSRTPRIAERNAARRGGGGLTTFYEIGQLALNAVTRCHAWEAQGAASSPCSNVGVEAPTGPCVLRIATLVPSISLSSFSSAPALSVLKSRSSGAQSGSIGASSTCWSSVRASALRPRSATTSERKNSVAVLRGL